MARPRKQPTTDSPQASDKPHAPSAEPDASAAAAAFARLQAEASALTVEELRPVNIDIPLAVATARAALPRLQSLRDDLEEQLPHHPLNYLDKLEDYALAAWFGHFLHTLGNGGDTTKALSTEAAPLRQTLLVAAEALSHKGLLDAARVQAIRSGQGHKDTAKDLVALAALYREGWPRIKNKTAVEQEEIERASSLGQQLLAMLSAKDAGVAPGTPEEAEDRRTRAFTLFVRAYDENVRAVTYLRWKENDVEAFLPSVFKAPRTRKPRAPGAEESQMPPAVEGAPGKEESDVPPILASPPTARGRGRGEAKERQRRAGGSSSGRARATLGAVDFDRERARPRAPARALLSGALFALVVAGLGARSEARSPAPTAQGCVLLGESVDTNGTEIWSSEQKGEVIAVLTGQSIPLAMTLRPEGRAFVRTGSGTGRLSIQGFVDPASIRAFTTRDVPVVGGVRLSANRPVRIVDTPSGQPVVEMMTRLPSEQRVRAASPCASLALGLPAARQALAALPPGARVYRVASVPLELGAEAGGPAVFTLTGESLREAYFWSAEQRGQQRRIRHDGDLRIDAWVSGDALVALPGGQRGGSVSEGLTARAPRVVMRSSRPGVKAARPVALRQHADPNARLVGTIEPGCYVEQAEVSGRWSRVETPDFALSAPTGSGFWAETDELGLPPDGR